MVLAEKRSTKIQLLFLSCEFSSSLELGCVRFVDNLQSLGKDELFVLMLMRVEQILDRYFHVAVRVITINARLGASILDPKLPQVRLYLG